MTQRDSAGEFDERAHPLVLGDPERHPAPPGPPSSPEVAADDGDGDLVHEHRLKRTSCSEQRCRRARRDLHLRVNPWMCRSVRNQSWEHMAARAAAPGGRGPPRPGRSLGLAGGRPASWRKRAPRLRSRRCARRLCSPDPANLPGHSAPPPAPASQSARGGGRGPATGPAAEAAAAGGARRGGGAEALRAGGGARAGLVAGEPRARQAAARRSEGIPAPHWTPVGVALPACGATRSGEGSGLPSREAERVSRLTGLPQRAAGCFPKAVPNT